MNRDLTQFERLVCPVMGHNLTWRGKWVHRNDRVEDVMRGYGGCPPGATFPHHYYKLEGR